jgi:hypothetical protein
MDHQVLILSQQIKLSLLQAVVPYAAETPIALLMVKNVQHSKKLEKQPKISALLKLTVDPSVDSTVLHGMPHAGPPQQKERPPPPQPLLMQINTGLISQNLSSS